MTDRKLTPATRDDVIQAIQHGMLFDGRKRSYHWDRINAQVAAEKLADYLAKANFVVMQGRQHRTTPAIQDTGQNRANSRWPHLLARTGRRRHFG